MNWSKTKTILIIALIITNAVMLGYLYLEHRQQTNTAVADRQVYRDVVSVLAARDITVAFQNMPETEGVQAVEAEYETPDLEALAPAFLPEGYTLSETEPVAQAGQETLTVADGVRLLYKNNGLPEAAGALAEEEALELARQFLSDHGYPLDENTRLGGLRILDSEVEVTFVQQLGHRLIENGQMRLMVSAQGVRSFERTWLRILEVREMTYEIIPPGRALLKLSETLPKDPGSPPVIITSMTVGYRLDTDALSAHILSGDLSPYWRFTTRTGVTYSVKALQ